MSSGKQLQEMEVGTKQSKTAVNANAKPGMPMEKLPSKDGQGLTPVEDLGGPTPDNYKPDNDSAKLKAPGATLKQVKDVVNKNAKSGSLPKDLKAGDQVEVTDEQEVVAEEPATEEVVAEAPEVAEEEVVEEINIEDDVNALLGGEELSEEFREKAKLVFETALNSKVSEVKEEEVIEEINIEDDVNALLGG